MTSPSNSAQRPQSPAECAASAGLPGNFLFRESLAFLVASFSVFVWVAFATVPSPNPWMMGEAAFTRILITYGVALVGAVTVCCMAPVADWRLKTNLFRWLSLPCAAFLIVVIARAWLGLPLSIG